MSTEDDNPDDIPVLRDVVRPGRERPAPDAGTAEAAAGDSAASLSDAEIEAIAQRIVEGYTERLEAAIERGIRRALEIKAEQGRRD